MSTNFSNVAVDTTLTASMTDSVTDLDVASDTGYPAVPFNIKIDDEVIRVTARTTTDFSTVVRGYDGTTAAAHSDAAAVTHVVIAEDMAPVYGIMRASAAQTITLNVQTEIVFAVSDFSSPSSIVSLANNAFVVPVAGIYEFMIYVSYTVGDNDHIVIIQVNDADPANASIWMIRAEESQGRSVSGNIMLKLSSGDSVTFDYKPVATGDLRGDANNIAPWATVKLIART